MQRNHRRSRALALLLLFVLIVGLTAALSLLFTASRIQADDTGWHSPGSDNATSTGTGGDGFEINPTYAYADDNVSAENHGGLGDGHLFYNFGLPVPLDATVKGIQVRLDWYLDSDNGTSSMSAELSWDGGDNWTSPLSDSVETTTEHTAYLGSSTDNWGRSWTPNEFTDSNFRVRITCNSDTAGNVFYLEYLSVVVYYAPVDYLQVIGDGTMTAGESNILAIRARDTFGDIAVNYNGPKSLTFSGPSQAPGGQIPTVGGTSIGSTVSVTFTNGVSDNATATTLVAYNSETTTVDVSDGTIDSYADSSYDLNLTVNPDTVNNILISPDTSTITAGYTETYTTQSFDQFDNLIADVTADTDFSIDSRAGGSWATSVYTSQTAGTWTVTGSYLALTDNASLTVNAGALDHIVISPDTSTITAGNTQTYTAEAFDQFNNTLGDVTASTAFSIDAGAGGSWATNIYTSQTAGTWAVTGTYSGLTDTATLNVNAGALDHIVISPDTSTITASNTQTYTAEAFDQFNNTLGDVTASTAFSIDAGAGGSWATNIYTSQTAGTWTVTGTYSGLTDTASLTVNAGALDHIVVSPDTSTVTAGNTQTYTAEAFDQVNNTLGDVTGSTAFSIDAGAGGSWATNVYTSEKAGSWTVTGTYSGITDTASLTVNAGALTTSSSHQTAPPSLPAIAKPTLLSLSTSSIAPLPTSPLTRPSPLTEARAAAGPPMSMPRQVAGTWTVTGSYSGFTDTASLTVNAGPLHHIVISPDTATITAGNSLAYSAQCMDQFDNLIVDVTTSTAFSIDAGAGGGWAANVYTSANAGTWTVTGTYLGLTDTVSLTVNTGALHHIVVSPDTSTITAGGTQTYTAQAFDQANNTLGDVTTSTVFSVDVGAGGSWAANVYTSANAGTWTVTGTYIALTDTASLTVNAGALDHIVISPDSTTIVAGNTQVYTAQSFDQFNNPIADVTASTVFSIDAGAGGSWAANVYTSQTVGPWTVTGTHLATYSDTASLTVNPGALHHIVISPDTATITAGNYQDLHRPVLRPVRQPHRRHQQLHRLQHHTGCGRRLERQYLYLGHRRDVDRHRHLHWTHRYCQPDRQRRIVAPHRRLTRHQHYHGRRHPDLHRPVLRPVQQPHCRCHLLTAFSIQAGAGGSWAANVYTSANAGTWTVTGTYQHIHRHRQPDRQCRGARSHRHLSGHRAPSRHAAPKPTLLGLSTSSTTPSPMSPAAPCFSIDAGAGGSWADQRLHLANSPAHGRSPAPIRRPTPTPPA